MDNGQHLQGGDKTSNNVLFANGLTEGVGTQPGDINPDSAESLHSSDQSISWQTNPQEIGDKTMNSSDKNHDESSPVGQKATEIVDLPSFSNTSSQIDEKQPSKAQIIEFSFNQAVVKTTNRGLDPAAIKEAEKIEDVKLNKEDNAADYYEIMRDMAHTNTDNSYGSNSAWKEAA